MRNRLISKQIRFVTCISVPLILAVQGCIVQSTELHAQSTLVEVKQSYGRGCYRYDVKPGAALVLEMWRNWGLPLPHMINGYSLYIEMNPSLLAKEAFINVPSADAHAFLYMIPDKCTEKVMGFLKIVSLDEKAIWMDVSLEAKDVKIDWSHNGSIEFKAAENK